MPLTALLLKTYMFMRIIGPGGVGVDYVEVGFVINILNQVFGWDWSFRVIDQQIGKKQVWVKGELSIRVSDHEIIKGQFGGTDIQFNKVTGEPVSIADSLKIAVSDCLKKCASMLGIAGDIYWGDLDTFQLYEEKGE